jgi:hypothetical protein
MKLKPLDLPLSYSTLNALLLAVNDFAEDQGYEVIKKSTKKIKKGVLNKAVLRCDKGRDFKPQKYERRETSVRSSECSFDVVVKLRDDE